MDISDTQRITKEKNTVSVIFFKPSKIMQGLKLWSLGILIRTTFDECLLSEVLELEVLSS